MRKLLLLLVFGISVLNAQPTLTVNNLLKYAEGENYLHREDIFDMNIFYNHWTLQAQFEAGNPPEFGTPEYGLHTFRLEYRSQSFRVEIGDVYPLWNRGLSLNLRYERDLGYDSGIRGINVRGDITQNVSAFAVAGSGNYQLSSPLHNDVRTHDWTEKHAAAGGGLRFASVPLLGKITLSGVFVRTDRPYFDLSDNFEPETQFHTVDVQLYEGAWQRMIADWDVLVNHAVQYSVPDAPWMPSLSAIETDTINSSLGNGTYASLSGLIGEIGISIDYKNYAYDIRPPAIRNDTYGNWPTRMTAMSRPPIVFRESSATLTSRQTHLVRYNDEIGMQVELNYYDFYGINIVANYAVSSRHRFYRLNKGEYESADERNFFPGFNDKFAPFRQGHLQLERYFLAGSLFLKQTFNRFYAVDDYSSRISFNNDETVRRTINITNAKRAFTTLTQIDYTFANGNSVALYHENQWLRWINDVSRYTDSLGTETDERTNLGTENIRPAYNRFVTLSFSHHVGITLSFLYDYASETEQGQEFNLDPADDNLLERGLRDLGVDMRNKWFGVELTADIARHHQVTVFYGSEQGGLRCANGVCRQVAPFQDGFKLIIQSYF